ncbi:MAG TPA: NAD(P)/FAD-dependent oxidoreductase, partial [Myxococcales bacterium]|nr:NAD(P)/FAD-dependent oxidoreductase [Myxococcales bacterium]
MTDAVVVGGGFAGLAAAAGLSSAGLRVTVLEPREGPPRGFRGELIHPPGARLTGTFGLEEGLLRGGAEPVRGFAAFASPDQPPVLLPYSGASGFGLGLEHGEMLAAFRSAVQGRRGVDVVAARAEDVVRGGDRVRGVRTDRGEEIRADLVVGADGRHSRLRGLLGLPTRSTLLSYSIVPALDGDVLPQPGFGNVLLGAPGPILAYPFGKGRVRMVIDVPSEAAQGRDAIAALLRERYVPVLPEPLRGALRRALEGGPFAGAANHAISTESCAVPGAVLVGDAGGCSHPLTATGMTAALHDVKTLADCLRAGGATDAALLSYEKRRYRFVRARELFSQALYDVFRGDGPGPRALRDGVFHYWRESDRARRASMDILSGDDSSALSFASEYCRVVGISGWGTVASALRRREIRSAARNLPALLAAAGDCLGLAVDKVRSTVAMERTRRLETACST